MSIVRLSVSTITWLAFGVGVPFNGIMVWLIVRHTPKAMRIYSKILLQTCFTDIILLVMTLLFTPYVFVTAKGETEALVYGIFPQINGVPNRIWATLAFICWVFLVYVSLFGYVSQFIFRYLVLVRENPISSAKYFFLLFVMLLFPCAYCVNYFICNLPPVDHALMEDSSVAQILGLNLDDQILLAGYSFNDLQMTFGFYYIIIVCTIAYIAMFYLAFLIQNFLDNQLKNCVSSSMATKKMIEMNKQVARNLIVQVSLPFVIYLCLLFLLVMFLCKIDTSGWAWLQYYNLIVTVPFSVPSALNPFVSICIIKYYRRVFVSHTKNLANYIKLVVFGQQQHQATVVHVVQHQQKHQPAMNGGAATVTLNNH